MNEKKTILFLMNGFGAETGKSFEVFNKETVPTFEKLMGAYPFKLIASQGETIGLNETELSNFETGYANFGTFGHPVKLEDILQRKIDTGDFKASPVINGVIDRAVQAKTRLHVYYQFGDRLNEKRLKQFIEFIELCQAKGLETIYMHFILGDNSAEGLQNATKCMTMFRNKIMRFYNNLKITSFAGKCYFKNGTQNDIADYYRMQVSGVGEVWIDYTGTIQKKYAADYTDDNMNPFVTLRENILKAGDQILFFNYDNYIGKQFIDVVQNPKKYFPTVNCPENITVTSVFPLLEVPSVQFAFQNELPQTYFLEKIPESKKVLIIACKKNIPTITSNLNGGRPSFTSNVAVWPIEDDENRLVQTSQYLAAYINQATYDLIIVDYELYDSVLDKPTTESVLKNLKQIDDGLNIAYTRAIQKDYRLIVTSLYGMKKTVKFEATKELVDLSSKTPFMLIDKDIRKEEVAFSKMGTITDISRIIATTFGNPMPNNLIRLGGAKLPEDSKKQGGLKKMLLIAVPVLLLLFVVYYLYMMGYIG